MRKKWIIYEINEGMIEKKIIYIIIIVKEIRFIYRINEENINQQFSI